MEIAYEKERGRSWVGLGGGEEGWGAGVVPACHSPAMITFGSAKALEI